MARLKDTSLINDANLIAYYLLENVNDSKGSNNLTNSNSVAFNPAKYDNGADFSSNNTNKVLSSGNNLGLAGNGAMSMVGWIKIYNTTDGGFLYFNSTTTADRNILIKQDGSGNLAFLGGGTQTTTPFVDTGSFHHIAITRDGSGNHLGYLDGVQKTSWNATGTGDGINNFQIGAIHTTEFASVIVDDTGIFNRVLTIDDLALLVTDGFNDYAYYA